VLPVGPVADEQLDQVQASGDTELYNALVTVCEFILDNPAMAQRDSAAITTDGGDPPALRRAWSRSVQGVLGLGGAKDRGGLPLPHLSVRTREAYRSATKCRPWAGDGLRLNQKLTQTPSAGPKR
jgi:hypothetical protein